MGVIIKESAKQTVVRIGLSALGALATLFIYPLNRELYGILGFILDSSLLIAPMVIVGLGESSIKFFPFKNEDNSSRTQFFRFLSGLLLLNTVVVSVLFFLLKDILIQLAENPSNDYSQYFIYILPAAICFGATQFFVQYISNYKIVTLPVFIQSLYRIGMPLAFVLIYFHAINMTEGIHLLLASLGLSVLIMAIYAYSALRKNKDIESVNNNSVPRRTFFSFYFWAFASSVGSLMAFKLDGFMVPTLTNFESSGDYRISVFIASIIAIPIISVVAISSPIISQAWKDKNMEEIKNVYLRGSKNLLYIGAVMLLGILLLVDVLPHVLESWKQLRHIKYLVIVIGFAKLIDMTAGVNGVIIQHSPWYRYNTIFVLIMMLINVVLNLILIKAYGIMGAAIATAISLVVFNVMKAVLLHRKIDLNPFDKSVFRFIVVYSAVVVLSLLINNQFAFLIALLLNTFIAASFSLYYLFKSDIALETRNSLVQLRNSIQKIK